VFHCDVADPVNSGISSNNLMRRIHKNDLKVFVGSIRIDPIRIEDSEILNGFSSNLFSNCTKISSMGISDTLVFGFTIDNTNMRFLSSSSSVNPNSKDYISRFGFVPKLARFINSKRTIDTHNMREMPVFPAPNSCKKANHIRGTHVVFGDGPRMCIGMRFSLILIKVVLATLLTNYEISPCEKTEIPPILAHTYFLNSPTNGVWLNLKRICSSDQE